MADNYKITGQTEVLDLNAQGGPSKVVEVAYETVPSGIKGTVSIPKDAYSADAVHRAVDADATTREAVAGL